MARRVDSGEGHDKEKMRRALCFSQYKYGQGSIPCSDVMPCLITTSVDVQKPTILRLLRFKAKGFLRLSDSVFDFLALTLRHGDLPERECA